MDFSAVLCRLRLLRIETGDCAVVQNNYGRSEVNTIGSEVKVIGSEVCPIGSEVTPICSKVVKPLRSKYDWF